MMPVKAKHYEFSATSKPQRRSCRRVIAGCPLSTATVTNAFMYVEGRTKDIVKSAMWVPAEGAPVNVNPATQLNIWLHLKIPNKCCRCISVKEREEELILFPAPSAALLWNSTFMTSPLEQQEKQMTVLERCRGGGWTYAIVCSFIIQLFM